MIIIGLFSTSRFDEKKRKYRRVFSTVMLTAALMSMVLFLPLQFVVFNFSPNTSSHTDDPANYLELDRYMKHYLDEIYEVFPITMPQEARNNTETTRYSYSYQHTMNPWFYIYAEWQLSDSAYEAEKAENIEKGVETVQKGGWVCVFLNENGTDPSCEECIELFAYNDSTKTVRYALCYSVDYTFDTPDYNDLDWN